MMCGICFKITQGEVESMYGGEVKQDWPWINKVGRRAMSLWGYCTFLYN